MSQTAKYCTNKKTQAEGRMSADNCTHQFIKLWPNILQLSKVKYSNKIIPMQICVPSLIKTYYEHMLAKKLSIVEDKDLSLA